MHKRQIAENYKRAHGKKSVRIRFLKVAQVIGACVAALAIINLGFQCVWYLKTGNYYGHTNYWHQPVGTLLLAAVLITFIAVGAFRVTKRLIETLHKKK
ncbi:MAG TPA: hypothetical protein VMU29_14780 [Smithella sp.]|nr:hypothetical protein [Smithella sp.]